MAAETLRDWLRLYRKGGFDALLPKPRADRGEPRRLPPDVIERLVAIKEANLALSVRLVIGKRPGNYIFPGLVGIFMMSPSYIDIHGVHHGTELIEKSDQPPALVRADQCLEEQQSIPESILQRS